MVKKSPLSSIYTKYFSLLKIEALKSVRAHILIIFILLAFISNAQSGNRTLDMNVSLHTDSITKSALLDTLSRKYNLHFSYNPILLEADNLVKLELKNESLSNILKILIDPEVLNFKAFDQQIVFFPVQDFDEVKRCPNYKMFKGTITTGKNKEPIPYCNISIIGKSLGTMSNANGEFAFKIPEVLWADTIGFSCLGFEMSYYPVRAAADSNIHVVLFPKNFALRTVDIVRYDPANVLGEMDRYRLNNYENDFALMTTFYRELTMENEQYTDISEAVLEVMKAPYSNEIREDHVKFLKGRKGAVVKPFSDIKFKLMGGPYYITKLDVVKNDESFINTEFRHLYEYKFDGITLIDNRETIILSFSPINNMRDILFEGKIYIDKENWGIARIEFEYTKQGLKAARNTLIQKEPKKCKAIPTSLDYVIQYKYIGNKWYLLSARSLIKVKLNSKDKKEKTKFENVSEILITNIEKGDLEQFSRKDIFKSNEVFTDKIVSYDRTFWDNYNVIKPEEKLVKALKNFDDQNLIITYKNE